MKKYVSRLAGQQGTPFNLVALCRLHSFSVMFFFFFFVFFFFVFFFFFLILVEHIFTALQIYITVNFSVVALVDLVLSGCRF